MLMLCVDRARGLPFRASCAQQYWEFNCSTQTALEINWKSAFCKGALFQRPLRPDLNDFETAFVNAAVHVGIPLLLRGVGPVRDNTTATGWV